MLAIIPSAVVEGVYGRPVTVEVHVAKGLPAFSMVGLPDASVREARDRVRAAILSSDQKWPSKRITVSLAPSEVRKHGATLDVAIAIGVLVADGVIKEEEVEGLGFIGELGLDGSLRRVPGLVSLADAVNAAELIVPLAGAEEAAIVKAGAVRGATDLKELIAWLTGVGLRPSMVEEAYADPLPTGSPDLADVRGQPLARFALEVAAAGGHHMLMVGPPGAGKTMLATRMAGLLPALNADDALLTTRIHSVAGLAIPDGGLVRYPPFRAPHHGASAAALVGGGGPTIRPGEASCAHAGVLFLDELGEFPAKVLDALRQPLEEGVIRISRVASSVTLPARFQLIGAMNPCPCGFGGSDGRCRCSVVQRVRYASRVSGPILDRFDIRLDVRPPDPLTLIDGPPEESSQAVAERVAFVRLLAADRGVLSNALLDGDGLAEFAPLAPSALKMLREALSLGLLTARGLRRVRCVARTIADLQDGRRLLDAEAVGPALTFRAAPETILGGAA